MILATEDGGRFGRPFSRSDRSLEFLDCPLFEKPVKHPGELALVPAQAFAQPALAGWLGASIQFSQKVLFEIGVSICLSLLLLLVPAGLQLVQVQDIRFPNSAREVVLEGRFVDVQPPQTAMTDAPACLEPEIVVAAWSVRFPPVYQQPLPGKLLNAGERQIFQFQGLVGGIGPLDAVVAQDRCGSNRQAGVGDLEQRA